MRNENRRAFPEELVVSMEKTEAAKYFKNLFQQCFAGEENWNNLLTYYIKELTFPSSLLGKYHHFLILFYESLKSEKSEADGGRFENLGLHVAKY